MSFVSSYLSTVILGDVAGGGECARFPEYSQSLALAGQVQRISCASFKAKAA